MINIQKQERDVMKKGSIDSKLSNKIRCVCEEYDWYLDEDYILKISHRQGEKDENLIIKSGHIIFKRKLFHVLQRVWQELDDKGRYFFVSYNNKFKHNEYMDEIYVPSKFQDLFKDKYSTPRSSTPR